MKATILVLLLLGVQCLIAQVDELGMQWPEGWARVELAEGCSVVLPDNAQAYEEIYGASWNATDTVLGISITLFRQDTDQRLGRFRDSMLVSTMYDGLQEQVRQMYDYERFSWRDSMQDGAFVRHLWMWNDGLSTAYEYDYASHCLFYENTAYRIQAYLSYPRNNRAINIKDGIISSFTFPSGNQFGDVSLDKSMTLLMLVIMGAALFIGVPLIVFLSRVGRRRRAG